MNSPAYFEIQASNPKVLVDFYGKIFNWKFTEEKGLPIEYHRIDTEGMRGAILARPANVPPTECGTNAFTCSMQVEDFDATAKVILENGGMEAMPKFAVPGKCWQGYFLDPDHNVFGLFEVDENAR